MSNKPQIIDLFSGVGGLSLGAAKAGFSVAAAVEFDKKIIDSHAINFPRAHHIHADVSQLVGRQLLQDLNIERGSLAGLIGGPPCQGFSTMGKRNIDDSRNQLFLDFFRLAYETLPTFFLAENVPGILNERYQAIREKACRIVEDEYDILAPIKINASQYGAATTRTRVFFIGVRKDIAGASLLHDALLAAKKDAFSFVETALYGLPVKISDSWQSFDSSWQYLDVANSNEYITRLNEYLDDVGNEDALNRYSKEGHVSGSFGTKHSEEVSLRYANLLPGQQDPISKSTRLKQDGFCPTLRAGTDSSKGSFQAVRPIHPTEARVITPREAARLQGFPDWFQFHETKWHSFRQIGNSVCPIAAAAVLRTLKNTLNM